MITTANATPFVSSDIQLKSSIFINSSCFHSVIFQFLRQDRAFGVHGAGEKSEIKFIEIKTLTLLFELSPLAAIIISFELTANAILNQLKVHGLNATLFLLWNARMHTVLFFCVLELFCMTETERNTQWGASHALKIRGENSRIFIESKTNKVFFALEFNVALRTNTPPPPLPPTNEAIK